MDHQVFDTVARLFGASGSRRTAWRALLAGALLGATSRSAAAAPCTNGTNSPRCTCGETLNCPPGKCFVKCGREEEVFCCTEPDYVICGNRCCINTPGIADPCADCPRAHASDVCLSGIAGSYRRR